MAKIREEIAQAQREIFAQNLNYCFDKYNKSQSDLAYYLEVTTSTVSDWANAKKYPRVDKMQLIADFFGVPMSALREKQVNPGEHADSIFSVPGILPIEVRRIPLLGDIACGEPMLSEEHFEGYVEVGTDVHADFALRAKGDSMIGARIMDGDIVFVRRQPTVEPGEIAAVLIGDEATLKRFRRQGNLAILSPENPQYEPIVVDLTQNEDVRILGKAIAFQSDIR